MAFVARVASFGENIAARGANAFLPDRYSKHSHALLYVAFGCFGKLSHYVRRANAPLRLFRHQN